MLRTFVVSALLVATAAVAEAPETTTTTTNGQNADPNEVICRSQPVIGSRVNRIRVCRTRAEWANSQAVNAKANPRGRSRQDRD